MGACQCHGETFWTMFQAGYGCMLMALTSLGVGLFVSSSASFSSLWQGLLTVCSLLTGNTSLAPDRTEGGLPAELFLMTVAVFGTGLLTCWVVAVLTRRLRLLRRGRPMESQTLGLGELASHLWSSLLFSLHVQRANTTEERDQYMPPEFILAEMVYQVDELLFRMNALCGSSGLPDKPIHYLTDSDATQGPGGDDGISSGGSEEQVAGLGGCGRDSERLEQRVQKIEDKLYANEPYLAQLLKLDSIGADVLSQEREKQLRSHLELEIFRQLQMQRQECPAPGCRAEAPGGGQQAGGKMADCQDFPDLDRGGDQGGENVGLVASALQHLPPTFGPPSLPSGHSMVCTEGSLPSSHSLTETTSSGAQPSGAPPHTAPSPPPSPPSLPTAWLAKPWSASSDTGSSEGERGGKFPTTTATEGKEECQFPHSSSERRQAPSLAPDKPMAAAALEMKNGSGTPPEGRPSKCSPAESRLRPLRGAWQQVAGGEGAVPRSRPSGPLRVGPEQLLPHGEGAVGWLGVESSSGSEQDSSQGGRRSYGRRNLRKTKSRGKGKGEGDLAPPLLLTHLQEWEGGGRDQGLIPLDHSPPPPTRSAPAPDVSPEHSF